MICTVQDMFTKYSEPVSYACYFSFFIVLCKNISIDVLLTCGNVLFLDMFSMDMFSMTSECLSYLEYQYCVVKNIQHSCRNVCKWGSALGRGYHWKGSWSGASACVFCFSVLRVLWLISTDWKKEGESEKDRKGKAASASTKWCGGEWENQTPTSLPINSIAELSL